MSDDPVESDGAPDDEPLSLLDTDPVLELVAHVKASGGSDDAAGLAVGRSAKYVQRARNANPLFVQRVRELQERRAIDAAATLGALLEPALDAIQRGLSSERTSDQLRAAALVLDRFKEYRGHGESAETVAEMKVELVELRELLSKVAASQVKEVSAGE